MEQSSCLALQKEPGPHPGRVPSAVTFESVRGIRSIYKLGLAIVNISECSEGQRYVPSVTIHVTFPFVAAT